MSTIDEPSLSAAAAKAVLTGPPRPSLGRRVLRFWPAFLALAVFFIIWHFIATTVFDGRAYLVPGPIAVGRRGWELADIILQSGMLTLRSAIIGYAIAIVGGIGFALLLAQYKPLERSLYPWAVVLQVTPIIAIAPIIIIWFGFNATSIVIITALIAYFPILNNTHLGLVSTEQNQVELFQLENIGRARTFWHLRLPNAIPSIIGGLRISAGLAITGTILGEFVIGTAGSFGGLGVRVIMAQATLKTTDLFAYVIATTLLGLMFFAVVSQIGYRLLRDWHESARSEVME